MAIKPSLQRVGELPVVKALTTSVTPSRERLIAAAAAIALSPGTVEDACYLHTVLCQVGMPRKRTEDLTFERTNGSSSLLLTAGKLWNDKAKRWEQQQLPYGPKPRLVLINLTSKAIMTGSRVVDVGRSTREFLDRMGLDAQGSEYRSLRRQLEALSACRMQLGGPTIRSLEYKPIDRLDVWIAPNENQQTLWPGKVELDQVYFDNVREYAVPLDERAIAALRGSALALDIYTWLAQRLIRVKRGGLTVEWSALKSQFGQEYGDLNNFRTEFLGALLQVVQVYRSAQVETVEGGLMLKPSAPPIPRIMLPGIR